MAVFTRTRLSILHSQWRNNHLFRRKNRMVHPDSLNVGMEAIEREERRFKEEREARIVTGQSRDEDRQESDTEQVTSTG